MEPPKSDTADAATIALDNQRELRRLVLSVRASLHKLNLLIAISDDPDYRDDIIQTYEAELTADGIVCHQITLKPLQPSLKQALLDWQAQKTMRDNETIQLVTVVGTGNLSNERLEQPKSPQERFCFSLQWTREALREFKFPVILWLTHPIATTVQAQAPDFWSWRGGTFEFTTPSTFAHD